ncbi:nascent polypeptide-associated complex subunit alpha, muscle-specific form-like [Denticeps clupeoides]|uniref:nascent polypeptide-associated complex subunit alpha, muscle-specific form-like n=1 Tax=Denticeps clupeoides TaxID=299321 RepID=UPI0010A2F806|nr:nascent polypeptide-associated complex subunit alpha, muscle-specific form-like [Denticeps clupeoides]
MSRRKEEMGLLLCVLTLFLDSVVDASERDVFNAYLELAPDPRKEANFYAQGSWELGDGLGSPQPNDTRLVPQTAPHGLHPRPRRASYDPRSDAGDEGRGVRGTVAEDWPAMRPLVVCGDGAMTLSAQGRAYAHLLVDRGHDCLIFILLNRAQGPDINGKNVIFNALFPGTASPVPLFHLPASCGYSVESSLQKLVLKAKYDGCHVIHENGSYVLPLLWWGVQVKVSCPDVPKLKSSAPLAFCCTSGIVLKAMGPKERLKTKVEDAWMPIVSTECAEFVEESLLLAPFAATCITVKEGLYTLDIMSDGLTFRLTCPPEFGPLPPPYPTSPVHQTTLTPSQPSSASPADDTFYPPFSNFYIPPPLHPPSLHPTVLPPLFPHDSGLPPYYYSGYRADPYFYLPAPSRTQPSVPQSFQNFPFPNAPPHYFHPYYNYVYPGHKPTEDPLQPKPPRQPVTRTPTKADVPPHRFSLPAPGQRPAQYPYPPYPDRPRVPTSAPAQINGGSSGPSSAGHSSPLVPVHSPAGRPHRPPGCPPQSRLCALYPQLHVGPAPPAQVTAPPRPTAFAPPRPASTPGSAPLPPAPSLTCMAGYMTVSLPSAMRHSIKVKGAGSSWLPIGAAPEDCG